MELMQYFSILRKWYRLILLGTLLAGFTALVVSFAMPPTYEAEAAVAIVKSGVQVSFDPKIKTVSEIDLAQAAVDQTARRKSLTTIAKSLDIANAVIAKIGDSLDDSERIPADLAGSIEVTSDGDLIKIKAKANSGEKAALIANTWAQEYERRVNLVYGENPLSLTEIQSQVEAAKRDYDEKEAAVISYLANNPVDQLTRQIAEKQQIISSLKSAGDKTRSYLDAIITTRSAVFDQQTSAKIQQLADLYTIRSKIDRLLADAKSLRTRLSSGPSSSVHGGELAGLLLEASAFSTWANLPVHLQIPINQLSPGLTSAEQSRNLDTLIATLEDRRKTVEKDIEAQSKDLLSKSGSEFLALQLEGLEKVIDYSAANKPITQVIDQLQQEVNQLQSQLEQENAKKQELIRARDLAWSTYTTLANKAAEVNIAAQAKGSVVRLAVPAAVPDKPAAPKKMLNTLLASVVGLMLGVGVAFLLEYLNDNVTNESQVAELLGLPTVGAIPEIRRANKRGNALIGIQDLGFATTEAFRLLQHNLSRNGTWKVLLVASALPYEGKSIVAANLAASIARIGKKVTLVDADFRHPAQHKIFGLQNDGGLSNILDGFSDHWEAYTQATEVERLRVITSGSLPSDPPILLESPVLGRWMEQLKAASDVVIIDTPAALGLADATILARAADAIVMVIRAEAVSRRDAVRAKEQLASTGVPIMGVVLNRTETPAGAFTYEYYENLKKIPDLSANNRKGLRALWGRGQNIGWLELRDRLVDFVGPRRGG